MTHLYFMGKFQQKMFHYQPTTHIYSSMLKFPVTKACLTLQTLQYLTFHTNAKVYVASLNNSLQLR